MAARVLTFDEWLSIIQAINSLCENPPAGCNAVIPLVEPTSPRIWTIDDVETARDKLLEICNANIFTADLTKWNNPIVDELYEAIVNGYCNCVDCEAFYQQICDFGSLNGLPVIPVDAMVNTFGCYLFDFRYAIVSEVSQGDLGNSTTPGDIGFPLDFNHLTFPDGFIRFVTTSESRANQLFAIVQGMGEAYETCAVVGEGWLSTEFDSEIVYRPPTGTPGAVDEAGFSHDLPTGDYLTPFGFGENDVDSNPDRFLSACGSA